jgi:hypothetical protein
MLLQRNGVPLNTVCPFVSGPGNKNVLRNNGTGPLSVPVASVM